MKLTLIALAFALALSGCGSGPAGPDIESSAGTIHNIPNPPAIVTTTYPARSFAPALSLQGRAVIVAWMANTDSILSDGHPGISGYQVLRGTSAAGLLPITGVITTTTYEDQDPPASGGYVHYAIRAAAFQLPDGTLDTETATPGGYVGDGGEAATFGQTSTANEIFVPPVVPTTDTLQ